MKDGRRCKAHAASGDRCKNAAILGATVCRVHGGSAPQVKRKATERIAELRDVAAEKFLLQLMANEVPSNTTMAAVRDLTRTLNEMYDREAAGQVTSVVDEWLEEMRKRRAVR